MSSPAILLAQVRAAMEDEYTIEREIGRGGMAAVFLARDLSLERPVAIKVMLPDLVDVAGLQDRFVSEARTAARLDHPGIVTVYSVKQRDGLLFIIMKYVEGQTLDEVLQVKGRLEPTLVAAFGARISEALHFAHAEGIVHRDIKPSNVIIDKRGRPVITDFGIAKVLSARSVTVVGSVLGTPTYMSPEQCRGYSATGASDQYSLGIMMYEMLAGRVPFTGGLYELVHAHTAEVPPPLRSLVPSVDPMLEDTVMKMLAKEPSERWATMSAVAKRLMSSTPKSAITQVIPAEPDIGEGDDTITMGIVSPLVTRASDTVPTPAPGLSILPAEPMVEVDASIQLTAAGPGDTPIDARIVWQSEDQSVADVDQQGRITGRSAGFAKVTATSEGAFGRVGVIVVPPSDRTIIEVPPAATVELQPTSEGLKAKPRLTTGTAVRQRNIGLMIGIGGAVLGGIALVIMLKGGSSGDPGAPGSSAQNPPAAATGPTAPPPATGSTGPIAPPGATGSTGSTGASGSTGQTGQTGSSGPTGATGRSGTAGRGDSTGSKAGRLDSATTERCRKLRERWSVGDSLTVAEDRMLKGICTR